MYQKILKKVYLNALNLEENIDLTILETIRYMKKNNNYWDYDIEDVKYCFSSIKKFGYVIESLWYK